MCIILVLESAQWEADVASGMFMFCMPEALLLVVLKSIRNLLTLKLQPKILCSILEQLWTMMKTCCVVSSKWTEEGSTPHQNIDLN